MNNEIQINKSSDLKKHVSIIHCSNKLSLLQRKICNILLYNAFPCLMKQETHKISVREICEHLHYQGGNHNAIKDAMRALVSTVMEWNLTNDSNEDDWTASSILASVSISGAVCTYAYSPHMRELLYAPSMYGKVNLLIQSRFNSNYGLALYENCVRYKGLPRTKEFPFDMFRQIMGVGDKYPMFRDFKRRVLDKAIEEVNTLTDILVNPIIKKVGRKVVSITFQLKERERKKRIVIDADQSRGTDAVNILELRQKLEEKFLLSHEKISSLINKYGAPMIKEKTMLIESSSAFMSGKIANIAGYLIDALEKNYMLPRDAAVTLQAQKVSDKYERAAQEFKQKSLAIQLQNKESRLAGEHLLKTIDGLSDTKRREFVVGFELALRAENSALLSELYRKHGFNHPAIMAMLRRFIDSSYPSLKQEKKNVIESVFGDRTFA